MLQQVGRETHFYSEPLANYDIALEIIDTVHTNPSAHYNLLSPSTRGTHSFRRRYTMNHTLVNQPVGAVNVTPTHTNDAAADRNTLRHTTSNALFLVSMLYIRALFIADTLRVVQE